MTELSIVLPAKNESKNIRKCIEEIIAYCLLQEIDYELLVINDHSNDRTANIVKSIANNNSRVVLLHTKKESGYGIALHKGIHAASKKSILILDADLQYDITDLEKFLPLLNSYDAILGYRKNLAYSWNDVVKYKLYQGIVRIVLGIPYKDVDCNFKIFKTQILKGMAITSINSLVNIEILMALHKKKFTYIEIPVAHYYRKFKEHKQPLVADISRIGGILKIKFKII